MRTLLPEGQQTHEIRHGLQRNAQVRFQFRQMMGDARMFRGWPPMNHLFQGYGGRALPHIVQKFTVSFQYRPVFGRFSRVFGDELIGFRLA